MWMTWVCMDVLMGVYGFFNGCVIIFQDVCGMAKKAVVHSAGD